MCNRIDWLEDYVELQEKVPVTIGDGSKMYGIGRGNMKALTYTGEKWIEKKLNNVVFVPDGYVNLFSANKALDNGHTIKADADTFKFYDREKVAAIALRRGGLFQMMIQPLVASECENLEAHVAMKTLTLQMWHERLGHQHNAYVRKFLRNRSIEFIDDEFDCDGCAYGKQHRLSFESRTEKSKVCGELIHGDLWGPYDKSIGGSVYFVVFKDDFSHMRFVYCLKNKTEIVEKLQSFIKFSEKQWGHQIKAFQTDQGTECDNFDVNKFLKENGIQHRRSVVYTPEQNGSAEREMRTIVESARSMIHAKGLNENLWAEAVHLAVYVLNRTGTSTVKGKTPYELWHGKSASIENLRAFGTGVYVHVPKQKRRKMEPKSKKCIFVGFDDNIKGYRVYNPDTGGIEVVRDVKFLSDEFNTIKILAQVHGGQEKSVQTDEPVQMDDEEPEVESGTSSTVIPLQQRLAAKTTKRRGTILAGIDENNILESRLRNHEQNDEGGLIAMALIAIDDEPQTYREAIESPKSDNWERAMQEEYDSLLQNHTWELVEKPHDQKVIDNKWVFKIKNNPDDSIERYKARLVARGFNQQHGIDYEETFSPVVRFDSIRTLFAIAVAKKLKMRQFDVKTAFLYGDLHENVYMKQPIGFSDNTNKVCKLRKSLYGLKQSSRCWNQKFKDFISEFGFKSSKADPCVFVKSDEENTIILCIYVDDGMIFSDSDEIINQIIDHLKQKFEIKVVNAGCYLGIEIDHLDDGSIFIHQTAYARKVIRKFNMENCIPVGVPSDTNQRLSQYDDSEPSNCPYRQLIGSVMYLAMCTRPDLSYAIGVASRYLEKPSSTHVGAAKRILKYINGTLNHGILYSYSMGEISMNGYSDSDYAGDLDTRRSTTGFVFTVNGSAITWCSRRQSSVSKSTTEAEYIAASEATSKLIWLKRLLNEIVPNQFNKPTLYIDNESARKLVKNPVFHRRTKHIDVA